MTNGEALSFRLWTEEELNSYREAVTEELIDVDWIEGSPGEQAIGETPP